MAISNSTYSMVYLSFRQRLYKEEVFALLVMMGNYECIICFW